MATNHGETMGSDGSSSFTPNPTDIARRNWATYVAARGRGHQEFCLRAKRNTDFYLGDQWDPAVRAELARRKLPAFTFNQIMPVIDAAVGYQIHNRMDITAKAIGGAADTARAEILSKMLMHELDRCDYHSLETDMFGDGLRTGRGFIDIRVGFSSNLDGEIEMFLLDPMDVIPDPDAKGYDPKSWKRVHVTRWYTGDEVAHYWGQEARDACEKAHPEGMADFGRGDLDIERSKFGIKNTNYILPLEAKELATKRYRIIDTQERRVERKRCLVVKGDDVVPLDSCSDERIAAALADGARIMDIDTEVIRWTVSTEDVLLFDEDSPLDSFSVVMYSPRFIRGSTVGMIDNIISSQEAINKAMSMAVHNINATAQGGYFVEEDSLYNMDEDDLAEIASSASPIIRYKKGANKPERITPNPVPQGFEFIMNTSSKALKDMSMPEAMTGQQGQEISGVAIQSRQFAAQQQLAVALDFLARTRRIIARNVLQIFQKHYSGTRIIRITEQDPETGKDIETPLEINGEDQATGGIINDITVGKYDICISEQPMQITFDNSQFTQVMEMKKAGLNIPDSAAIKHSNLADKYEILAEMKAAQQQQPDPEVEAKVALLQAQTKKVVADTAEVGAGTVYTLTQAAMGLEQNVRLAKAIDSLGKSVGFQDMNGGTIADGGMPAQDPTAQDPQAQMGDPNVQVPQGQPSVSNGMPQAPQTNPLTAPKPVSALQGANAGIETMRPDMVGSKSVPQGR